MKKRRWFKSWSEHLRDADGSWLFVHKDGDYEYRNPTSVFVHRWETFSTREDALDWLDRCIPKVEWPDWSLYRFVCLGLPEEPLPPEPARPAEPTYG